VFRLHSYYIVATKYDFKRNIPANNPGDKKELFNGNKELYIQNSVIFVLKKVAKPQYISFVPS
jgi:hypothetical protein